MIGFSHCLVSLFQMQQRKAKKMQLRGAYLKFPHIRNYADNTTLQKLNLSSMSNKSIAHLRRENIFAVGLYTK